MSIPNEPVGASDVPTPNNPPWNSWMAAGVWFLSVVFVVVIPQLFLLPYIAARGISFEDSAELKNFIFTDKFAILLQLGPILLAHVFTIGLAWLVVTQRNTFSFRKMLGWEWNGFRIWHAVAIIVGFYVFAQVVVTLFGKVENDFDRMLESSRAAVYLVIFFATFTAPLAEEVVYRGLLYSAFQRRLGVAAAAILATVLFTVVHIPQYSSGMVPDYATIIVLLALSMVLTLIRIKTGNLLPCIVLHTLFNGTQSIFLLLEPFLKPYLNSLEGQEPAAVLFHFLK